MAALSVPFVAPELDPSYSPEERAYVRAAARRRWLRANGIETGPIRPRSAYRRLVSDKARRTNREIQRRYRIRVKALQLGITVAEAAAMTPRYPNRGKHAIRRDTSGRFATKRAPVAPGHERQSFE